MLPSSLVKGARLRTHARPRTAPTLAWSTCRCGVSTRRFASRRALSTPRAVSFAASDVLAELPKELTEARRVKRQGLTASALLLGSALLLLPLLPGKARPVLPESSLELLALGGGGVVAVAAVTRAVLGEKLLVEFHNGALYLQFDPPKEGGPCLADDAVEVRPSPGKGNGAFATQQIAAGTFLGVYEGEMLDEVEYWKRYPSGVADYCMGVDRQWTIDACERARDTCRFSPCHINHSAVRANVSRRSRRSERRVSFYAARDIQAGEELLLDYGKLYWTGREEQAIE